MDWFGLVCFNKFLSESFLYLFSCQTSYIFYSSFCYLYSILSLIIHNLHKNHMPAHIIFA